MIRQALSRSMVLSVMMWLIDTTKMTTVILRTSLDCVMTWGSWLIYLSCVTSPSWWVRRRNPCVPSEQSWVKKHLKIYFRIVQNVHCNPSTFRVKCKINIFSSEKSQVLGKALHGWEKVCAVVYLCCLTFLECLSPFLFASDLSQRCLARGLGTEWRPRPTWPQSGSLRHSASRSCILIMIELYLIIHLSARETGHGAVSHQHAGHRLRARCVQEWDELAADIHNSF